MLNACHPATTDRYTGYFGLPGTNSDDQSRRVRLGFMAHGGMCEIDPVLEYRIFHGGASNSGLSVLYTLNSDFAGNGRFRRIFQTRRAGAGKWSRLRVN